MSSVNSATGIIKTAWSFFTEHVSRIWILAILMALPSVLSALSSDREKTEFNVEEYTDFSNFTETVFGVSAVTFGFAVVLLLVLSFVYSALVYSGSLKIMLKFLRGKVQPVKIGQVFSIGSKYLGRFVLLGLSVGAIVLAGSLLLIIPGIIAAFLLSLSFFFLVDKELGVKDAMLASFRTIKANLSLVLLVYVLMFLIAIAVSILAAVFHNSDTSILRAVGAIVDGFVGLFWLVVVSKLYLSIGGKS